MAKKKFYAVKQGFKPGIYKTWPECEANTKGFKGAKFKSFLTLEEAQNYLNRMPLKIVDTLEDLRYAVDNEYKGTRIFVDGSFNPKTFVYGAGVAVYDNNGKIIKEIKVNGNEPGFSKSRNIAGEALSAITAIDYAIENNLDEITIIHDYEGIARWVDDGPDGYAVGSLCSAIYYDKYREAIDNHNIKIHFIWVRGHIGIEGNEVVDRLAKDACGIK